MQMEMNMNFRKLVTSAALGAALIGGSLAATPALAQHWHGGGYGYGGGWHGGYGGWRGGYWGPGFGVYIGPGFYPGDYWGGYYPYPYPYAYGAPAAPSNYVEQGSAPAPAASAQQNYYWYRCDGANGGYYPYVKSCPGGWQKETPQAPQ
jgi:hypothetical protein